MQRKIPCVLMRGGTSRGPYFLASDLPAEPARRDAVLLCVMGSPHALQVDGIGGSNTLTSKVAIVSRSQRVGADVDYLFAQVSVTEAFVDTKPNCGNMLAGVGPFAIEAGLVRAQDPSTTVRIFNVNTETLIEAVVQTPQGRVEYAGDTRIDGVAEPAAPIKLTFLDALGAVTGKLLPTGKLLDSIQGVEATCIDMAMPVMIMAAEAFGKTGRETPEELDADKAMLKKIEAIRLEA
jgi:4-oxalomesaconate tautomerase